MRVITYEGDHDILDQYIRFCMTLDEQRRLYKGDDGLTAIRETIRICIEQDILKDYLQERREEVVDIMLTLFSQQEAEEMMIRSVAREAAREAAAKQEHLTRLENIKALMKSMSWPAEDAMKALEIPASEYDKFLAELAVC